MPIEDVNFKLLNNKKKHFAAMTVMLTSYESFKIAIPLTKLYFFVWFNFKISRSSIHVQIVLVRVLVNFSLFFL